jgi:lipopolysaccharide export system protein LptA
MSHALKYLLLLLYAFLNVASALPSDKEQLMHIAADSYLVNYKTGEDVYEGDVKVDQGTTHLIADKLVTKKDANRKIISAIAYGFEHLAEFSTLPKEADDIFFAKGKIIKFFPQTQTVSVLEEVSVIQGKNSFKGPIIIYNMKEQIVSTPASKNGRATIVIDTQNLKS